MCETDKNLQPSRSAKSLGIVASHSPKVKPSATDSPSLVVVRPPAPEQLLALLDLQKRQLKQKVKDSIKIIGESRATDSPGKMLKAMKTRDVALAMLQQGAARRRVLKERLIQEQEGRAAAEKRGRDPPSYRERTVG
ncbi:hypothetical protein BaRGS_00003276 [Batillaria attramentaria]|uniref:Uncharacterized protein n=1 Tax=Batillaria attramentaria TaxID=370345 RepID=A0ABD0M2L1_9CAEN